MSRRDEERPYRLGEMKNVHTGTQGQGTLKKTEGKDRTWKLSMYLFFRVVPLWCSKPRSVDPSLESTKNIRHPGVRSLKGKDLESQTGTFHSR